MKFTVVLIDDEDREELPKLIEALGDGDFEVLPVAPPPDLKLADVVDLDADLFLVDYELDTKQPDGSIAEYLGLTLAARLREIRPDHPIALLTRRDLERWANLERIALATATFDDILYKDTGVEDQPEVTHARLVSLASGYQILRKTGERSVSALLGLLKTDEAGQSYALEALPPGDGWREFEAAHWIRSVLLQYPGVLYDEDHAATALGISLESFRHEAVQNMVRHATYHGPFAQDRPRWWRHTLFDIGNRVCADSGRTGALREGFRLGAGETLGLDLAPSADAESGVVPADTVCYLLRIPVRIETSLPYDPDARPRVMENARISFRAVRESNAVEERYLDEIGRSRLEALRTPD